jgi:glycerophosphoryl diester phosphodiesterase
MAVAPDGTMLGNLKSKIGILKVDFDPTVKYYKKKGFYGTELVPHYKYIDDGRRPWLYRTGGSAMVAQDMFMKYPRTCAHRGFNKIAPENSMPAYGAAVALGAEEIEFDLWMTKDGELVSIHDPRIDRTSDGVGKVTDYTLNQLKQFDFGVKAGGYFKGLEIMTFEDILKKFSCQTIMNIHVKECEDGRKKERAEKIVKLLYQYDAEQHANIMSSDDELHEIFMEIAPEIRRCMGAKFGGKEWDTVEEKLDLPTDARPG